MTTPAERRRYLATLRDMTRDCEHSAALARNGDNTAHGERVADRYDDERYALNWALRQLGTAEGERQMHASVTGTAAESSEWNT